MRGGWETTDDDPVPSQVGPVTNNADKGVTCHASVTNVYKAQDQIPQIPPLSTLLNTFCFFLFRAVLADSKLLVQ